MLILDTITHETIWGGQRLMPYSDGSCSKIGHLYSLLCENGHSNKILNGSYQGRPFHEYFMENKNCLNLGQYKEFPLILALVEANDNLSIQVHPDDYIAKNLENYDYGKNESWYFIQAPEKGYIYNGCTGGSIEEVKRKVAEGDLESITDHLKVENGDYVYVEAGTLHALSTGSFLYEIEENCPLTYRLYDFNRRDEQGRLRELHLEKALKAIKVDLKSKVRRYANDYIEERRYITQLHENINSYSNNSQTLECLTMLDADFVLEAVTVKTGTTIILEPGEMINVHIKKAMMARPK